MSPARCCDALALRDALEDAVAGALHPEYRSARQVFFRADSAASEKSGALPTVTGLVADAGFDAFVRQHWDALVNGDVLAMNFRVPSRLHDIEFKVQRVHGGQVDGVPVQVFRLKLSSVLGWFLTGIDVSYTVSDHTLIRYAGLSDLRDAANDNFQAQIDFPPGNRRTVNEQALQNAMRARLAPCQQPK